MIENMIKVLLVILTNEEIILFFIRLSIFICLSIGALLYLILSESTKAATLALISAALVLHQLGGWWLSGAVVFFLAIFTANQVNSRKLNTNWLLRVAWYISIPAIVIAGVSTMTMIIQIEWLNLPNPWAAIQAGFSHVIWVITLMGCHAISRFITRPKKKTPEFNSR